jgi:hypothetical protein
LDDDGLWLRVERMRESLERVELRLFSVRQEVESSCQREKEWLQVVRVRDAFRADAVARRRTQLGLAWASLKEEAERAAEFEREQTALLERCQDELALTVRCATSDLEEMARAAVDHLSPQ